MGHRFARDAAGLSVGAAVSGVAAYAFAAIGSRSLGADAFAPVSVLWTAWAVTGAAVAFPIQHWVIRRIHADGGDGGIRHALPRLVAAVLGASVLLGFVAFVLRADLFRSGGVLFPAAFGAIPAGAAVMGLLRGRLAADDRFVATSVAFAGENLIRVAGGIVAAAAGWGAEAFALILIGGFAIAAGWPATFRFREPASADRQLGFLAGIAGASSVAQLVLTGAPFALALGAASAADITSVFAALALFRAPYVIATGIAPRITASLTRSIVAGESRRLRRMQLTTTLGTALASAVAAAAALTVAPPLLRTLFGPDIALDRTAAVLIAVGSGIALGTLTQGLILISRARWGQMLVTWLAALAVGLIWLAVGPGTITIRTAAAFALAEGVAFVAMLGLERQALRRPPVTDGTAAPPTF